MELFFSANLLLFVFIPIKLDGFVSWSWAVVLIPLWIVMAVTIVAVLYGVILAAFLWRSPDVNPAQKRASLSVAVGYACAVVPLLVFEILLTGKLDESTNTSTATSGSYSSMSYSSIFAVLDLALCALVCTSFTARGSNQCTCNNYEELHCSVTIKLKCTRQCFLHIFKRSFLSTNVGSTD